MFWPCSWCWRWRWRECGGYRRCDVGARCRVRQRREWRGRRGREREQISLWDGWTRMVRSLLSVDYRFWIDHLRLYIPVVSGIFLIMMHDYRGITFFLAQPLPQRSSFARGLGPRRSGATTVY